MIKALIAIDPRHLENVYGGDVWTELSRRVTWVSTPKSASELHRDPSHLRDVEVLFTGWGAPTLEDELLASCPNLKAVFHAAGSVRPITSPAFWRRGISITHAASANAVPVAEFCLGAIFMSLKRVWALSRQVRAERTFPVDLDVPGAFRTTVGLISMGSVARRLAGHLALFDFEVLAHDPFLERSAAGELGVEICALLDLFRRSDVVSLHTPLLETTRGLITGEHLAAMKSGATFINTARGAVIREHEMIAVLRERPDLTVILDVTDPEPPGRDSPLYTLPNVVLTPHVAGSYGRECRRLALCMLDEFDRYAAGQPMLHALTETDAALVA